MGAAGAAVLTATLWPVERHEGELMPERPGEGGQRAEGGLGAAAGARAGGCEGHLGPDYAAGAGCEVGQRSGQLARSEAGVGDAVREAAVGAGQVPAGYEHGEQELPEPVAGWGAGRPRGSPVEDLQWQRAWALVWGAGRFPVGQWRELEGPHWGSPARLGAGPAASAAGLKSLSRSRCPGGWGCWGTCCDCPGRCLWGHCCPHR